jgi:hypothetical protein
MEHADAIEQIELAALEPDGLDRLMAGDTADGAAVAGHLAGCPACVAELARIRRTAAAVSRVIRAQPDPELRERTLAFVREVGRDRSGGGAQTALADDRAEDSRGAISGATAKVRSRPERPWLRYAGIAAALLVGVVLGAGALAALRPPAHDAEDMAVLQETTRTAVRAAAQPDTRRVALSATEAGSRAAGTLLFSPSTGDLAMVASGLAEPAAGQWFECWVDAAGQRRPLGRMYRGGDLQVWAGSVPGLALLPPDARFGVSLVAAGGGAGQTVLTGS